MEPREQNYANAVVGQARNTIIRRACVCDAHAAAEVVSGTQVYHILVNPGGGEGIEMAEEVWFEECPSCDGTGRTWVWSDKEDAPCLVKCIRCDGKGVV